jgi:uncharacterized protein YcbK (DUF882 family)
MSLLCNKKGLSRRHFLGSCAAIAGSLIAPTAVASLRSSHERQLAFRHLHTGEKAKLTYWSEGEYLADSLQQIDHLLRDFRSGTSVKMDKSLLDLLYSLQNHVGKVGEFQIISAYRSPKTNEMLRGKSRQSGVAKRSLHMQGKAMDIRLQGVDLKDLRKAAIDLKAGGVGYYPKSNFIHVDTGRVRYW